MKKVLVTGASGFIAKHIVKHLLEKGYAVRGSIRSTQRKAEVEALFPEGDLEFVELDLTSDDGWPAALEGVDVLMHTASPFPSGTPKDPMELIGPAVEGTRRALEAAAAAGVRRVILTSSCVAIYQDSSKPPMAQPTEDNWSDPEAKFSSAYDASKTLAERKAWELAEEHSLELTTINPGAIFGPALDENYGTSLQLVEQMLNGDFPAYPRINLPMVDARDVAFMHVHAIDNPATVGERFAANAGGLYMIEAARILAEAEPERRLKLRQAPDWMLRIMALFDRQIAQAVGNLGRNADVDGSKAERVMGFTYIPTSEALLASAAFLKAQAK
ncbi:MAG: NAD-dependent epimerase/dehydratase family protein [Acidobacteriota bacterium]